MPDSRKLEVDASRARLTRISMRTLPTPSLRCAIALVAALLCCFGTARAQGRGGLSEGELRAPWEQHLVVLQSLAAPILSNSPPERRALLADQLAALQVSLGEYESQVDKVIDRIVGDPQFGYIAGETSEALGRQLADTHARFAALYVTLQAGQRTDVQAAQAALATLSETLARRGPFEADIYSTLGSMSPQQLVALATRWWKGEEQAIAVKKLVGDYRQKVEGLQAR
jgi:hypothetical protein